MKNFALRSISLVLLSFLKIAVKSYKMKGFTLPLKEVVLLIFITLNVHCAWPDFIP
jgi:hypothetical protein